MAFKVAGSMAFREGAGQAKPVLLEPMMKVEVVTPEEYMGDVMGDLNRRRGIVQGMEDGPAGRSSRSTERGRRDSDSKEPLACPLARLRNRGSYLCPRKNLNVISRT